MHITGEGGRAEHGGETPFPDAAAETDGPGESIVADGDHRTSAIEGPWPAAARADDAIESQSRDDVGGLHDEGTAAVTRTTRARHAGDGDRSDARAQLGRGGDDERAGLDEDAALQSIGVIGQDQCAITRLDEAGSTGELRRDRHAGTGVDAQGGRQDPGRCGERQSRSGELVIIARFERDAREDQPAERDVRTQRDFSSRAREIGDVIGREGVSLGRLIADGGGRVIGIEPVGGSGVPSTRAAEAAGSAVGVPEEVSGLGGPRRTHGEEGRGDHQRGARKQRTRLQTFH